MGDGARRTCREGTWLAVFGPDLTVVVPGHDRGRAARLWELLDGGASFEQVLDALVTPTLSESGEFVLVRSRGSEARLLVRGRPTVSVRTAQGSQEVSGAGLVWGEAAFGDVETMELSLPDSGGPGEALPAVPGLVRVSTVVWGEGAVSPRPSAPPAPPAPPVAPVAPAARLVADPPSLPPPPTPARLVPDPPETQAIVPHDADAEDETDLIPFEEPADRDGLTRFGATSAPAGPSGVPGQPEAPAVLAEPVARLVFSHGMTVPVDRSVIVGRAPEVRRHAAGEQPRLVTVPSPGHEISSTHLEIRPGSGADHGTATATDLGSTNGTLVQQPGLPPEELRPGIAVALLPGAVLDLGDGLTIQVIRP